MIIRRGWYRLRKATQAIPNTKWHRACDGHNAVCGAYIGKRLYHKREYSATVPLEVCQRCERLSVGCQFKDRVQLVAQALFKQRGHDDEA